VDVTTKIDPKKNRRYHTVQGEITLVRLRNALAEVYARPDYRPDSSSLWDLRKATTQHISGAEVQSIASMVKKHWGTTGAPRSALVVSTDLDYGMARVYEILMAGDIAPQVRVFRDLEEAKAWLTCEEDPPETPG